MEGVVFLEMAKVTSKGQITIPVSIRRRLNIEEGDKLLFIDRPEGVVMVNPDMLSGGKAEEMKPVKSETSRRSAPPLFDGAVKEAKGAGAHETARTAEDDPQAAAAAAPVSTAELPVASVAEIEKPAPAPVADPAESAAKPAPDADEALQSSEAPPSVKRSSAPQPRGIDLDSLLDEIRSIGSKI